MQPLQSAVGLLVFVGFAWAVSENRRAEVVQLGLRSILAGTLATCCTGAVVGILSP